MKQELLNLTYELVDEIKSSVTYKRLLELKKEMDVNEEIKSLIGDFNKIKMKYDEVLKYGKYHPDLKKVQLELSDMKIKLFDNDVINEYKKLEKKMQNTLDEVSREIANSVSKKIKHPNDLGLINKH